MANRRPGRPRKEITIPVDKLPPDKAVLTAPEIAELTGYHVRTIQARLRDGTLQGKRLGGTWRIYRDSLINDKVDSDLDIEKR